MFGAFGGSWRKVIRSLMTIVAMIAFWSAYARFEAEFEAKAPPGERPSPDAIVARSLAMLIGLVLFRLAGRLAERGEEAEKGKAPPHRDCDDSLYAHVARYPWLLLPREPG